MAQQGRLWMKVAVSAALVIGAAGVLAKAASQSSRYDAEMRRLRGEWRTAQQAEGLSPRDAKTLYGKYPTPEITLCKPVVVAPGASAPVSLGGKFPSGTTFLSEHDQVTLTPGASTAARYAATAAVAADAMPGVARLFAYAPVSGAWSRCGAVVIGATPSFKLQASNGWTIALTPSSKAWTVNGDTATLAYKAEYYKPGAAQPFETLAASLGLSINDRPGDSYSFSTTPGLQGGAVQEYQELVAKMSDPAAFMKMSARERAAFEKRLEEVGDRMTKEMESMVANQAAMQAKQAEFGCGTIALTVSGATTTGSVSCGEKVGYLKLSGARS